MDRSSQIIRTSIIGIGRPRQRWHSSRSRHLRWTQATTIKRKRHLARCLNLMLDDFTLSAEDMEQIKTLDTGRSILFDHHDGDTTKMFMGWRNIEDLYKQV